MSGIIGFLSFVEKPIDDQVFADMLFLLERQGPDDQAYWKKGSVALGHMLLKTTRESEREMQPSTLNNKTWLSADVRIDGRDELLAKLRGKGVSVEQNVTDDQLILHAYALWGPDCLHHLIGDFAFVLWDEDRKTLFCATDHMGVSPLYYAQLKDGFVVANNVSAIRAHPQISDTLNEQAIGDYLLFRMNHMPNSTSFADINKLPAGHSIKVDRNNVAVERYWSVPQSDFQRRSKAQYLEEFDQIFKQSVADRMRTDSAGTHLSGGMDSTSITAILAELRDEGRAKSIEAYTHVPSIDRLSLERPFAEHVARQLNVPLHIIKDRNEMPKADIENIADIPPEPSFGMRSSPRFEVFSHSATKSRTFFAGYGGDPLLMPDGSYWSNQRKAGKFGTYFLDYVQHLKIHGRPPNGFRPKWMRPKKKGADATSLQPLPDWLNGDFIEKNDLSDRYIQFRGSASVNLNARIDMQAHPLWRRVFEWHSPAYSLLPMKVSFPFFDIRLIEWAQAIPPYPWMHRKYLLRAIMDGRLPDNVLARSKTPFPSNPVIAKIEEKGAPDWQRTIPDPDLIKKFINLDLFLKNANNSEGLTGADIKGIVRVIGLNQWLNTYMQLDQYVGESRIKLQKYKCRA